MDAYTSVIGTLQYILPKENIDLDYLNYSLMSVDFKKYVAGAAILHIYFKDYKNEPFLWMPLLEQRRIVSILDEAFVAISKAKANSEQNLKNAKELFESYLQGVFKNKEEGWEDVKRWKKSEYEDYKKYQLQQNDIVFAMDRPWVKAGLKIARLSKNDLPALLVQRTASLRTKSKLDNSFLFHLLK